MLESLDQENDEGKYLVVIEARSGGSVTGTGTASVLVTDINNHASVFCKGSTLYLSLIMQVLILGWQWCLLWAKRRGKMLW